MPSKTSKYAMPDCLGGLCDGAAYARWLLRKARTHVKRDRRRNGKDSCAVGNYQTQIHEAVKNGGDRDFYTGEPLDWSLIGKYQNEEAKAGRSHHKKKFWMLPTVDHTFDEQGKSKFVICSWVVNDAKSDLTLSEFYSLCERVLRHRGHQN
jgi:hypothetical protein